jgi:wyosine [tRNA(Phe)-imidazoG37] synthetase (radical SAM superfamily)
MLPLHEGIVYGPVRSRRLGHSLGISILPRHQKICTFNCGYCEYGWTRNSPGGATAAADAWPSPMLIARAVAAALHKLASRGERPDRLTLSGHGEPTLHPQFADVVEKLLRVRDAMAPGVPLAILSNSSTVNNGAVRDALSRLDERHMKLDAGEMALLRAVNGTAVPFDQILEGLHHLPAVIVQALFVRDGQGRIDNSGDLAVTAWIAALTSFQPVKVDVYTIDRAPAWPYLQPVPAARLQEIARRARAAGLAAEAFTPPAAAAARSGSH